MEKVKSTNGWLVSQYLKGAEDKLQDLEYIETANGKQEVQKGYEVDSIKMIGKNRCDVSFFFHDRAVREKDYYEDGSICVRNGDSAKIIAYFQEDRFFYYTEEEFCELAKHTQEMEESLAEKGTLYICGTYIGKDKGFNVFAVADEVKGDKVVLQRYTKEGQLDIGKTTFSLNDFNKYYRLANEEEIKTFEKNIKKNKERNDR